MTDKEHNAHNYLTRAAWLHAIAADMQINEPCKQEIERLAKEYEQMAAKEITPAQGVLLSIVGVKPQKQQAAQYQNTHTGQLIQAAVVK